MKSLPLLLVLAASIAGCGTTRNAYMAPPPEAMIEPQPQDDRGMYLALLQKMQDQGAYFASLAHIEAFRKRFGDPPELHILQANALRETGDLDAAIPVYRLLLKGPQAAAAWHGLGLIAAQRGNAADAETALANATGLDPLDTRYLGDLGFARLKAGNYADARAPLAKAAELAPGSARAVSNLALWALLNGQPDVAESMIQRAQLPAATQVEIQRLASQLRAARVSQLTSMPPAQIAATQADSATSSSAKSPQPPGSMLERFSSPAPHPTETLP